MAKKFLTKRLIEQLNMTNLSRAVSYAKEFGVGTTTKKIFQKFYYVVRNKEGENIIALKKYQRWIEKNEPTAAELEKQRSFQFPTKPTISIAVPTYNTPLNFLKPMVESVLDQTYSNWELCIADGSTKQETKDYLTRLANQDDRVKLTFLPHNYGIAGNTNQAIGLASGEYLALLDHDDTLAPFALYEVVQAINQNPAAEVIYSDEDKLTFDGKLRANPHFKPDWSPDNLLSYNYITHLLVCKMSLLKSVGFVREGYEGAQDFDLVLRLTEQAKQIVHIPKILYHWREHDNSTAKNADSKTYVTFSTQRSVADALRRRGIEGRVFGGPFFGTARVVYAIKDTPLVSIIIPTKDEVATLKTCLSSITNRTTWPNYEIIIVDTGSEQPETRQYYQTLHSQDNIKFLTWDKPFNFSAVNNYAAQSARGDYLLFLNNDVEIQSAEWIEAMLEFCQRRDVGAVGAKLFYPDFTIQHGGVFLGIGGVAGHSHKSFPRHSEGYYGRLAVPNNLSAVTAACIMVRTKVFKEIGGFDEGYPLAFNDIDLCLKIRSKGYLIVWTPYAQLIHYESKTRGYEDTPEKQQRFKMEIDRFLGKWQSWLDKGDPYYNRNLTLTREDFTIND
jgi:GT2 family glycosyltransferase